MSTTTLAAEYFRTKALPYSYTALEPAISEQTLLLHHDKHYAGYLATLNRLIDDTRYANMSLEQIVLTSESGPIFNNAAQAWNHEFYFDQLSPMPQTEPTGDLLDLIEHSFGTFCEFQNRVSEAALSLFGSGWVWLVLDSDNRLSLMKESNAGNPLTRNKRLLMTIDVWEHAYYCDYQNRRGDSITAFWSVVDWRVVEERLLMGR